MLLHPDTFAKLDAAAIWSDSDGGTCFVCGDMTRRISLNFEGWCCTSKCEIIGMNRMYAEELQSNLTHFLTGLAPALYAHIAHGDDDHREWLKTESYAFVRKYMAEHGMPQEWIDAI